MTIIKSADPTIFPDGQATTYSFTITNGTAAEPFYVVTLIDDRFGDLTRSCWATDLPVLAPLGQPGDSVTCTLSLTPAFGGQRDPPQYRHGLGGRRRTARVDQESG